MKGSIRMLIGFLLTFGAVGTLDIDPDADLLTQCAIAAVGLGIMAWGTVVHKQHYDAN